MGNKPSHHVYFVIEGKDRGRGIWQKIGVGWPHEDGKGLSLDLELVPIKGNGRIVVREPLPARDYEEGLAS